MIVQQTATSLRLIPQEQHALASGIFAHAWRGVAKKTALHGLLVQTIGLHDNPWRSADSAPQLNKETGQPHDFVSVPMQDKLILYGGGIDQLERVHPYTALLVSLHYTTFAGTISVSSLQQQEHRRRSKLKLELPDPLADEARWQRDLAYLKLFDNLSLFVTMTAPMVEPSSVPEWMDPTVWAKDPETDAELSLDWLDDHTLSVRPFPFAGQITLHFYYRELPNTPFETQGALRKAWNDAPNQLWTVQLPAK